MTVATSASVYMQNSWPCFAGHPFIQTERIYEETLLTESILVKRAFTFITSERPFPLEYFNVFNLYTPLFKFILL